MGTLVTPFPTGRTSKRDEPTNIIAVPPQDNRKADYADGPMTKAEREEVAELREMVHQLAASATLNARSAPSVQVQTAAPQVTKWVLMCVALFTFLGGAGSFIGNSGLLLGGKFERTDRLVEDLKAERELRAKELQAEREARAAMQARLDNLRTLYLIRFGEDPDKVTPETMNRRLQQHRR